MTLPRIGSMWESADPREPGAPRFTVQAYTSQGTHVVVRYPSRKRGYVRKVLLASRFNGRANGYREVEAD